MPNYDYECTTCNITKEVHHPMAGPKEKIKCDKCGGDMSKAFSTPYVKFNGPGWQTNDGRGIAKIDGGQEIDSSFME